MKICILTPRFPFPENGGDVLRINAIARYLKGKGHNLVLCSFYDNKISENALLEANKLYDTINTVKRNKYISLLNSFRFFLMFKPVQCGYYYSRKYLNILKKVKDNENADLYISHLLRMTPYLEKLNLNKQSIIEMTDALSKTYSLSGKVAGFSLKKIIYKFEKKLIAYYEQKAILKFPKIVLVSQKDVEF